MLAGTGASNEADDTMSYDGSEQDLAEDLINNENIDMDGKHQFVAL